MEKKFEEIYKIDVNDKTEKKGNLTYLSWAFAWAEFKKIYPEATYEVKKFDGLPYVKEEGVGYMVYTSVTADGLTYEMWLPVMDSRNHAILKPTMFEINKSIMRCLAKNVAMFGLGLYIYAGEDLPVSDKPFLPITERELKETWGIDDIKKTVAWFEKKFGAPLSDWDEGMTSEARSLLETQKQKRQREETSLKI